MMSLASSVELKVEVL